MTKIGKIAALNAIIYPHMEKMIDIAHKIKKALEIKGFSQEYMAMELNISQSQYQRI